MTSLVSSPDSQWVASGSEDGTIILWDANGQVCQEWVGHYTGVRSLAFSPDGRYLSCNAEGNEITIWDLSQDAHLVETLKPAVSYIMDCAWSPDGTRLACSAEDGSLRLWDTEDFELRHLIHGSDDPSRSPHKHVIAFSPNGNWLATSRKNHTCCIWNVLSGTLHKELHGHTNQLSFVAFNQTSTHIITASRDRDLRIWDVETGEPLSVMVDSQPKTRFMYARSLLSDALLSPDGSLLLRVFLRGKATIWDVTTGVIKSSLEGHSGFVNGACFSPCGTYVASASNDRMVRFWRTSDGSCIRTFTEHRDRVTHVSFSPDGKILSSGADDGTVVIRRMAHVLSVE